MGYFILTLFVWTKHPGKLCVCLVSSLKLSVLRGNMC